jgi:hypothetical protein
MTVPQNSIVQIAEDNYQNAKSAYENDLAAAMTEQQVAAVRNNLVIAKAEWLKAVNAEFSHASAEIQEAYKRAQNALTSLQQMRTRKAESFERIEKLRQATASVEQLITAAKR